MKMRKPSKSRDRIYIDSEYISANGHYILSLEWIESLPSPPKGIGFEAFKRGVSKARVDSVTAALRGEEALVHDMRGVMESFHLPDFLPVKCVKALEGYRRVSPKSKKEETVIALSPWKGAWSAYLDSELYAACLFDPECTLLVSAPNSPVLIQNKSGRIVGAVMVMDPGRINAQFDL